MSCGGGFNFRLGTQTLHQIATVSLRGSGQIYTRGPKGRVVGVGNDTGGFNLQTVFCLFENLKMFYPPEGLCRAEPERGPIVFTYVLLV